MKKLLKSLLLLFIATTTLFMTSCKIPQRVTRVVYQSYRTPFWQPDEEHPIPDEAEIIVAYSLSAGGTLTILVKNNTDEIMMIDQMNSFFVNTDGSSTSYYDPTVHTTTVSDVKSSTGGVTVNAGSIASALGAGGVATRLLSGVNVGGSTTGGQVTTNVTQVADLPVVSIAPRGSVLMSKQYRVDGVGYSSFKTNTDMNKDNSTCRFSVCISYSTDGGDNYDKITTDMYANSNIVVKVERDSQISKAVNEVYKIKTDAIYEPMWIMNIGYGRDEDYGTGILFDFQ